MKFKHKMSRPGYNESPCKMSPLNQSKQHYDNTNTKNIYDTYAIDVENYDASRNNQLSKMTQEQRENVQLNDTIYGNPSIWNKTQVAVMPPGEVPVYGTNDILTNPIYPPNTIAQDSGYSVVNPVDASLNRPAGDSRNATVTSIPQLLGFSPGQEKNLFRPAREAKTSVQTFKDGSNNQVSQAQYNQLLKTREDQAAAQKEFDAITSELMAGSN